MRQSIDIIFKIHADHLTSRTFLGVEGLHDPRYFPGFPHMVFEIRFENVFTKKKTGILPIWNTSVNQRAPSTSGHANQWAAPHHGFGNFLPPPPTPKIIHCIPRVHLKYERSCFCIWCNVGCSTWGRPAARWGEL